MRSNINEVREDAKDNGIIQEEVNLQYHWYLLCFFVIYLFSFFIPGAIFMVYTWYLFFPYYLEAATFLSVFSKLESIIALILMPGILLICYLLHLILIAFTTRWIWGITERISPTKEGIIPRNIHSKTINYYHLRSFMIKYPKSVFTKGMMPWLSNWFFNFVKTSRIGKGATIEEQVGADKFIEIGNDSYIGVNSLLTSHVVEGIFGNISYFKVKIGNNVTCGGLNGLGPGSIAKDNSFLLPYATGGKHHIIKGNNYYFGIPLRKIFPKKIMEYLSITPKDLEKNESKMVNY